MRKTVLHRNVCTHIDLKWHLILCHQGEGVVGGVSGNKMWVSGIGQREKALMCG